jgi:hypothetical protein
VDVQNKLLCTVLEDSIWLMVAKKVDIFSEDVWNVDANVQVSGVGLEEKVMMQENEQNIRNRKWEVTFGWLIER